MQHLAQFFTEGLPRSREEVVHRCIHVLHAHKTGVTRASLSFLLKPGEKFEHQEEEESSRATMRRTARRQSDFQKMSQMVIRNVDEKTMIIRNLAARWQVHIHGAKAVKSILSHTWLVQVAMMFTAVHPWWQLMRFCLLTPQTVRVALLFLKLASAGMTNSLFFASDSPLPDEDPSCFPPEEEFLPWMVYTATVGLLSAFLGDCVVYTLFLMQERRPIERAEWTDGRKARQHAWWRCMSHLYWVIWFAYLSGCLLYIMLFLANTHPAYTNEWLLVTLVSLLQDFIMMPVIIAISLGTASKVSLCSSAVRESVEELWLDHGQAPVEAPTAPSAALEAANAAEAEPEVELEPNFAAGLGCSSQDQDLVSVLPGVPSH